MNADKKIKKMKRINKWRCLHNYICIFQDIGMHTHTHIAHIQKCIKTTDRQSDRQQAESKQGTWSALRPFDVAATATAITTRRVKATPTLATKTTTISKAFAKVVQSSRYAKTAQGPNARQCQNNKKNTTETLKKVGKKAKAKSFSRKQMEKNNEN